MSAGQLTADRRASALLSTLTGEDWMAAAACTLEHAEQWWPVTRDGQETAAAYCRARCPVLKQCRQFADRGGETTGVWGGETEDQRRTRLAGRPGCGDLLHRCENCQKVYTARRPEQRYCGHACHNLAMAKVAIGGTPNPDCGTPGGARRHRKHGEPVDALCRYAESLYRAQCRDRDRASTERSPKSAKNTTSVASGQTTPDRTRQNGKLSRKEIHACTP